MHGGARSPSSSSTPARDASFRAVSHVTADAVSWWQRARGEDDDSLVAYFSMEFGIHERLPIYSGGLGVLAGDHLKAAAELGVPLVGVGLLYTGGYFRQGIDKAGRQTEDYQPVDPEAVGLVREDVSVTVDLAGEPIEAAVWRKDVAAAAGVVPLYLLEVDWLTDALYGGDREHRIRQELLLGVGGVRALAVLGIEPTVFHLNEGHSAFLQLERLRALVADGAETDDALESIRRSSVFTTHTPVPAGNEVFDEELVVRYVGDLAAEGGLERERLLALGRSGDEPGFGLTPFALRLSAYANGVSDLHGEVAREMWAGSGPGRRHRSATSRTASISAPGSIPLWPSCCGSRACVPKRRPTKRTGRPSARCRRRQSGGSMPPPRRGWRSARGSTATG